jgi:hypothetical protein
MIPPFDLFRVVLGNPTWVGTATTLQDARAKVQEMNAQRPGEYLILSLQTGHRESIKGAATQAHSTAA